MASILEGIARDPANIGKGHAAIYNLAEKWLAPNPLIWQAVLLYRNEEALFPLLLLPLGSKSVDSLKVSNAALAARIRMVSGF